MRDAAARQAGVVVAFVLALGALPAKGAAESQAPPGKVGTSEAVMVRATVESIDKAEHTVTLKGPRGKSFTVSVDEKAVNLAALKAGDEVLATYYEAVAFELKKPGEAVPGKSVTEGVAPPGSAPGAPGVTGRQVKVVATIETIDMAKGTVTLKGPEGKSVEVKAKDPRNLRKVKVGDLVEITYTEALAVSIQPAPKAPPAK